MNNNIKLFTMLAALIMFTGVSLSAHKPGEVNKAIDELVNKYDGKAGVECVIATNGSGLELIKMTLNKEMGKEFMKGVTSITIIDYSDAPAEICQSLRKDLDRVTSLVEQFDLTGNKDISDNDKTQCYACTSNINDGKISDFIIVIEEDKSKTIMYMEGDLVVK